MRLDDPVQYLKGVGPARAEDLSRLGIETVGDLLLTFPRAVEDWRAVPLAEAEEGAWSAFAVRLVEVKISRFRRKHCIKVLVEDDSAEAEAKFWNQPWMAGKLDAAEAVIYAKVRRHPDSIELLSPRLSPPSRDDAASDLLPVYPLTGGLRQHIWRKAMQAAVRECAGQLPDPLPPAIRKRRSLPPLSEAVRDIHLAPTPEARETARRHLAYQEALALRLGVQLVRDLRASRHTARPIRVSKQLDRRIRSLFPFKLTGAQNQVIEQIQADLSGDRPMNRMLQGDVGCGKTAVATWCLLACAAGRRQAAMMAPTELLARQHERTLRRFLESSPRNKLRVGLLTGSMGAGERRALLTAIAGGAVDVVVATHAAFSDDVRFADLGLVVIDEQHRFGVRQRAALRSKGDDPHTLIMSATPIPRSLAMTVYGDLDISTITALPPGRKAVKTYVRPAGKRGDVLAFLRREVAGGAQGYVVCPAVDAPDEDGPDGAEQVFAQLSDGELSGLRLGLLHGQMDRQRQAEIMGRFEQGELDVLVSTVVIEVGVDVPNATIMVVLGADRFGLAQLHQLRGRIARGTRPGICALLAGADGALSSERLAILEKTTDGFAIASEDLRLRGAGDMLGTRQSGEGSGMVLDLAADQDLLEQATEDAAHLLEADPKLEQPDHRPIRELAARMVRERVRFGDVG